MARSTSVKEALDLLISGTELWKLRDKGSFRGLRGYKRKYRLDLKDLDVKYIPHKGASKNVAPTACVKGEIQNSGLNYIAQKLNIQLISS